MKIEDIQQYNAGSGPSFPREMKFCMNKKQYNAGSGLHSATLCSSFSYKELSLCNTLLLLFLQRIVK
jgi:hypothetical protein